MRCDAAYSKLRETDVLMKATELKMEIVISFHFDNCNYCIVSVNSLGAVLITFLINYSCARFLSFHVREMLSMKMPNMILRWRNTYVMFYVNATFFRELISNKLYKNFFSLVLLIVILVSNIYLYDILRYIQFYSFICISLRKFLYITFLYD